MVGKITDFGLKQGKGFRKRAAHPHSIFLKVPPEHFRRILYTNRGHCARRSLLKPWKLGLIIVAWSMPRMFCEESLGKIKFRAFRKRVGPWILSLESVDYFGTSEHYWVVEKKIRILLSKTAMVRVFWAFIVCQWSVMGMRFIFGDDWNDVPGKSFFFITGNDVILWNRGSWIFV